MNPGAQVRDDRERWEARYRAQPPERKSPPEWLLRHLPELPRRGRALDVAAGAGAASLALARHGLTVTALDVAPTAVGWIRERAREEGLPVEAVECDVRRHAWPRERFDVISQLYFLDRDILPQLRAALRPGGFVVIETFSIRNLALSAIGPRNPEWCLQPGELSRWFADFELRAVREAVLDGPVAVQSIVARRPESPPRRIE